MSRVIYLASKKTLALAQSRAPSSHADSGRLADKRRLAHDFKNCVSVLLLGLATLDAEGDQLTLSARSRDVFEEVLFEMNGIVEELIHEDVNDPPHGKYRIAPSRRADN
jgi:hypothetical protein